MRHLSILILLPLTVAADPLITHVDGRQRVSLNGKWQVIVDPYELGYYNYRYEPDPNGWFKNAKAQNRWDLIEYSFDNARLLQVPGDWNSQDSRLYYYEGTVWYKKDFDYDLKSGRRLFLYFGAANYEAKVFLNGIFLGEHIGGFTPFNFEITRLVRPKDNFIVVKIDNKRLRDGVPTVNTDWWNFGGLTRRVELIDVPDMFVQDYFIQLDKGKANRIKGWIQLSGGGKHPLTLSIPELKISTLLKSDATGRAAFQIEAAPELWSPDNPKLYRVQIITSSETLEDDIGFRTLSTEGYDILLNGKSVFLRGICIHEQAPRGGRAATEEHARILLSWAKQMNCNFVRLAHYPHNEYMIRLADQMGLMVWAEIPVYWTILWDNPATCANAENQLTEIITRDKNRASVILWSMANETPRVKGRLEFIRNLADKARSLDPTRLLTAAMERHYLDSKTQMIDDPLGDHLDVFGCNEYIGWYDGLPEKCDTLVWKMKHKKPLIISEFGGGALQGYHGDALTRWTEEYQENLYQHQVNMLKKIPFLRGTTPWILMDFQSPRRPLTGIQDGWNRKGLISETGQKKKAFWIMRQWYNEIELKK
ncbi:beta galactosidase jelly roll domain-containing protein [bacterium]|nr:beta galactosidase jelly roll domain-containing protein [bacterium]